MAEGGLKIDEIRRRHPMVEKLRKHRENTLEHRIKREIRHHQRRNERFRTDTKHTEL